MAFINPANRANQPVKPSIPTRSCSKWLAVVCLLGGLVGCSVLPNHTGFFKAPSSASPAAKSYETVRPRIRIDDPADKTVVVYSHGTTNSARPENCGRFWNRLPRSLLSLQGDDVFFFYLCSRVAEVPTRATAGRYVYKRLDEIERTVDELSAAGVSADRIFLAGHSAGGWASLMAASVFPEKFNSVIAFAPAFAGRRSAARHDPHWRQVVRPRQIKQMVSAADLHALVFAYRGDPYNQPEDLGFLADAFPRTVRLVSYGCENALKHLLHLYDCQQVQTTALVLEFIAERRRHQ